MPLRLVILASGAGTLAQAIIDAKIDSIEIISVVSDVSDSEVLRRAQLAGLPTKAIVFHTPRSNWDKELLDYVESLAPDLVASLGFMRILNSEFVGRFKVINAHPALLPNFPGAHAVRDTLASGAKRTGCTIHWVDAGVDTGPIITQREVAILADDDESTLHERIKIIERELVVETLRTMGAAH